VAAVLLLTLGFVEWITVLFPLWVFLISVYILIETVRRQSAGMATIPATEMP
jgi:hypothetical protein